MYDVRLILFPKVYTILAYQYPNPSRAVFTEFSSLAFIFCIFSGVCVLIQQSIMRNGWQTSWMNQYTFWIPSTWPIPRRSEGRFTPFSFSRLSHVDATTQSTLES